MKSKERVCLYYSGICLKMQYKEKRLTNGGAGRKMQGIWNWVLTNLAVWSNIGVKTK